MTFMTWNSPIHYTRTLWAFIVLRTCF